MIVEAHGAVFPCCWRRKNWSLKHSTVCALWCWTAPHAQIYLRSCENIVFEEYLFKKFQLFFWIFLLRSQWLHNISCVPKNFLRKNNLFIHEFAPFFSHFPPIPEVGGGADAGQTADWDRSQGSSNITLPSNLARSAVVSQVKQWWLTQRLWGRMLGSWLQLERQLCSSV